MHAVRTMRARERRIRNAIGDLNRREQNLPFLPGPIQAARGGVPHAAGSVFWTQRYPARMRHSHRLLVRWEVEIDFRRISIGKARAVLYNDQVCSMRLPCWVGSLHLAEPIREPRETPSCASNDVPAPLRLAVWTPRVAHFSRRVPSFGFRRQWRLLESDL